jgi:hypothetical protein
MIMARAKQVSAILCFKYGPVTAAKVAQKGRSSAKSGNIML